MPVWLALIFNGCRATGQREWRWLHTIDHLPFYPHDAPDTPAYASLMTSVKDEQGRVVKSHPNGKVVSTTLPSWNSLFLSPTADNPDGDVTRLGEEALQDGPQGAPGTYQYQYIVARNENTMIETLFCCKMRSSSSHVLAGRVSARPVATALAEGRLGWRPALRPWPLPSKERCLVEVLVHLIKRGVAEEWASICLILGEEAESSSVTRYLQDGSTSQSNPADLTSPVFVNRLQVIGYITSAAPLGVPRNASSFGLCSGSALWSLRSLQYYGPRRDRGEVNAWLKNPRSSALHPIRLSLLVDRMQSLR